MPKFQRDKGKRGEREVAKLYRDLGGPYARARRHAENTTWDAGYDLDGCGADFPEVKNRDQPVSIRKCLDIRCPNLGHQVLWQKVNGQWLVTLKATRYLNLLETELEAEGKTTCGEKTVDNR